MGVEVNYPAVPDTARALVPLPAMIRTHAGLAREGAARFSFLLSIPAILLARALKTFELAQNPGQAEWIPRVPGAVIAGASAYLCIHYFLKLLDRTGMMPFVAYRMLLGTLLLYFAYN